MCEFHVDGIRLEHVSEFKYLGVLWTNKVHMRDSRIDRVPNAWVRELCVTTRSLDERIDEGVLRWFGHVEKMERDRINKRVYVKECVVGN